MREDFDSSDNLNDHKKSKHDQNSFVLMWRMWRNILGHSVNMLGELMNETVTHEGCGKNNKEQQNTELQGPLPWL